MRLIRLTRYPCFTQIIYFRLSTEQLKVNRRPYNSAAPTSAATSDRSGRSRHHGQSTKKSYQSHKYRSVFTSVLPPVVRRSQHDVLGHIRSVFIIRRDLLRRHRRRRRRRCRLVIYRYTSSIVYSRRLYHII